MDGALDLQNMLEQLCKDGRSSKATGRTSLFTFRCKQQLKADCQRVATARGMPLAQWMELALASAIDAEDDEKEQAANEEHAEYEKGLPK